MAMCVRFTHPSPGDSIIVLASYPSLYDGLQAADRAYKLYPAFIPDANERFRIRIMKNQLLHTIKTQEILPGFLDLDAYEKLRDLTLRLANLLT